MPAIASLEDLKQLGNEINELKKKYPEAAAEISALIKKRSMVGYRNFCKLFTGEWSPEELKSGKK